jgi:hypothetical protein
MIADVHSAGTIFPAPPVAWLTRALNDARRVLWGEAKPATELCGESAEFLGLLDDDED